MSSGFRPRWMDCDEPGWNPDSRGDSTAEPEQASDRMGSGTAVRMHRLSHPLHDARQRGGLRKRQEERQLAGRQNRVRHPAGADYDDGRKLHVYPGFFRGRRQLSDHRRAVVGSFADRARIGRRIRPHRARRIRRRGYPPALAFRANRPRIVLSRV